MEFLQLKCVTASNGNGRSAARYNYYNNIRNAHKHTHTHTQAKPIGKYNMYTECTYITGVRRRRRIIIVRETREAGPCRTAYFPRTQTRTDIIHIIHIYTVYTSYGCVIGTHRILCMYRLCKVVVHRRPILYCSRVHFPSRRRR